MDKITAIVPVRKGSQRVPGKNFIDFYKGKSLLELKIESLKKVSLIDEIVVNTDSEKAIEIAKKLGVNYYRRQAYYASSECTNSEHWHNLAETTESSIIVHTPCTAPLVKPETIQNAIHLFTTSNNDSCNSVEEVKEYLWLDSAPLNYKIGEGTEVPNSQDLPDVLKLTFGFSIIYRDVMLARQNVVGTSPLFYKVSAEEGTDIDTELDFKFAKFLYNQNNT